MPVIKSAKKKLRQDKKRTLHNSGFEEALRKSVKAAKKSPNAESIRLATQAIDKAVKHHIIHKNKAARMKSAFSKLLGGKAVAKKTSPESKAMAKSTTKKSPVKTPKKSSNKTLKK